MQPRSQVQLADRHTRRATPWSVRGELISYYVRSMCCDRRNINHHFYRLITASESHYLSKRTPLLAHSFELQYASYLERPRSASGIPVSGAAHASRETTGTGMTF